MTALNRLDIKQLITLKALLREKNLSKVAAQLGLTQQAVSDQLRKLRSTFNDRLFIRHGNGVQSTPFAEQLAGKLDLAIHALEQLLAPVVFDPATTAATFTISCTDFEQLSIIPPFLQRVRQQAPLLRISIRNLVPDTLHQDLQSGSIDLAMTTPSLAPTTLPSQVLYTETYQCVASKHNSAIKPQMRIAEIAKIPQVVVSPARGDFTGAINAWFEAQGHRRSVIYSFPTFSAALAALSTNDTCGFIPSRLLPDARLQSIELEAAAPQFDVIAVWHPRSSQDSLHQWIRQQLSAVI